MCVCVYMLHVCACLQRQEEGIGSLELEFIGSCEVLVAGDGN